MVKKDKAENKGEKFVKFCQQCGSTNLKPWVDAQIQPQYLCLDCDTIGFPIEGTEKLVAAIQKHRKSRKKPKKSKNAKLRKKNSKANRKRKRESEVNG